MNAKLSAKQTAALQFLSANMDETGLWTGYRLSAQADPFNQLTWDALRSRGLVDGKRHALSITDKGRAALA